MNKVYCNDLEINRYQGAHESFPENYLNDEKNVNELFKASNNTDQWWSEHEDSKSDSRKRWSYGSDASIEAIESSQSRLCCSPVDEFDSTLSSENEELIINNTDERDESYKDYLQTSPASSPTFKDVACSDNDGKDRSKSNDVDTADDELIDYSKRYTTDSSLVPVAQQQRNVANAVTRRVPTKKSVKVDPYGDYAETDLDQPTDYSLRYAEEDTDEDEKEDNPQFYCTREQEDTTKTYYTEGTPYETPCNFSASTSMSDLLSLEDNKEGPEAMYKRQFFREKQEKVGKPEKSPKDKLKKKYVYGDSKIPELLKTAESNNHAACDVKLKKSLTPPQSPVEPCDKEKECKTVSFNSEECYAQETPLMFSRCSSLDSLNEFDQHSINDDHSSVISDFSRRTSTVVSPSELPDSPTQTVPPSPRRLKQQHFQEPPPIRVPVRPVVRNPPPREYQENIKLQIANNIPHCPDPTYVKTKQHMEQSSVFEDGLVSFNNELMFNKTHSTAASSLSALTIDDDGGADEFDSRDIMNQIAAIRVRTSAAGMHQAPMPNQSHSYKVVNHSDCRNNRVFSPLIREEVHYVNLEESNTGQFMYVNKESPNNRCRDPIKDLRNENHVKNNNQNYLNSSLPRNPVARRQPEFTYPAKPDIDEVVAVDSIKIYCTEDTPTFISPFGSQSNLSALSMLSISDENVAHYTNSEDNEPPRIYYEEERPSSRADAYDTDSSSDVSEDDFKSYDDRRIDVSPFDSQVNLDRMALLSIEEEDEDEEEDDEAELARSKETDNLLKDDDYRSEDIYEESEEDHKVLEDCIKSGVRKVATSKETEKLTINDYRTEDMYEESEEDHKVLADCIKTGVRKVATSKETDRLTKNNYRSEDIYEESEEDHKVLEDCIKSGLRKVTRQRDEQ